RRRPDRDRDQRDARRDLARVEGRRGRRVAALVPELRARARRAACAAARERRGLSMLPIGKLEALKARFSEVGEMLCQPDVAGDQKRMTALNRERAQLWDLVRVYDRYREVDAQLEDDKKALSDPELRDLVEEEIPQLEAEKESLE